jgi:hypothetical protein
MTLVRVERNFGRDARFVSGHAFREAEKYPVETGLAPSQGQLPNEGRA